MHLMLSLSKRFGLCVGVLLAACVLSATFVQQADAHKFIVTAWVEGDTVYVESGFSDGSAAKNAVAEVYDQQGNKLIEGQTDEYGAYSFKVPKKTAMRIVVKAGMGHQGESEIPVEELGDISSTGEDSTSPEAKVAPAVSSSEAKSEAMVNSGLTAEDIQYAMEKALDKKLKPIMKQLAKTEAKGPSVSDIFAGIGYILGLVGLGAYFNFRKKAAE